MIHLEDINKTYDNGAPLHVLKGINLDIDKGEFVSIMGASGSGKSTLLNILGILDNYDTGNYYLNNVLIRDLSETKAASYRNRMIGFIFQSFNLISFKDAMENVALPLFYQGVSRKKRNKLAMEYLERLGLKDWAHHMPNEMSGGAEATRSHCPGTDHTTPDHPGRRTHRSVRQQDLGRGDGHPERASQRRYDTDRSDPRKRSGQSDQQDHPHQRRDHRTHRREPRPRRVAFRQRRLHEIISPYKQTPYRNGRHILYNYL